MIQNPIVVVSGVKGGVGKTMVSLALTHLMTTRWSKRVVLAETDTNNPDVYRCYEAEGAHGVDAHLVDLKDGNGWADLVSAADEHPDAAVVVNMAAGNRESVSEYAETLLGYGKETGRPVVGFWVVNTQRDSLELLHSFLDAMRGVRVNVVRNLKWGLPSEFELLRGASKVHGRLAEIGGQIANFPILASRVADALYIRRLSLRAAAATMRKGEQCEIRRWERLVEESFRPLLSLAAAQPVAAQPTPPFSQQVATSSS